MVCHHLAKFVCHRFYIGDIFLVCHVIKQDHVVTESGDYNNKNPSRNWSSGDIMVLVCHMI